MDFGERVALVAARSRRFWGKLRSSKKPTCTDQCQDIIDSVLDQ